MMDKAKAYDEALEKARQDRDAYQKELDKTDKNSQLASILRAGISALEMVFPQLTESDDRIRKCLQDIVNWFSFDSKFFTNNLVAKKDVIAYLEKQKEQSISVEEILVKAGLKYYKDGNMWCIFIGDNIQEGICGFGNTIDEALYKFLMNILEIQKDPKVDIDKLRRDLYQSGYNDGYQHGKEDAQKEQESIPNTYGCLNCTKWEECKKGLTPCSGHRLKIVDQKPVDDKAFEEWIDSWFKEHKEKAYPQITMDEKEFKNFCRGIRNMYQQKSDWNEEDEMMRENIISDLQYFRDCATDEEVVSGYNDEIAWLKDIFLNHKKFTEAVDKLWSNEWSEEDEEIIYSLRSFLIQAEQSGKYGSIQIARIEQCLNWLKALKNRM